MNQLKKMIFAVALCHACFLQAFGQERPLGDIQRGNVERDAQGRPMKRNTDTTLQHRTGYEDSVTVIFRYFDSSRTHHIDTSLNDFDRRFPVPYHHYHLGNLGSAAKSYIFKPLMKPGFDAGFHAYDVYKLTIEGTRFFETTRPFTELSYVLGSKAEQTIGILHTQNKGSNLNFAFNYRLISSPGIYQNQNTNHNNIGFNIAYQSDNKRYHLYGIYINNKLKASENGGLREPGRLDSLSLSDPFELLSRLGGSARPRRDPFRSSISTGATLSESTLLIRNQYDFGEKDSLVRDTVVYRLFYPRFRIQHSLNYTSFGYNFSDVNAADSNYREYFNYPLDFKKDTSITFEDKWKVITNEAAVISFPAKNNPNQFIRLAAGLEIINGQQVTNNSTVNYNNVYAAAAYRNLTRNRKWEIDAEGKLYTAGAYGGDFSVYLSLSRTLGTRLGHISVGAENVNRTPSFVYDTRSSFPLVQLTSFNKENTTRIFSQLNFSRINLRLFGEYYLVSNYSYFDSFYHARQEATLFNVLHVGLERKTRLFKNINWYLELHLQQATANSPVNLPFLLTRNRLAWEGRAFKNLKWSTGIEIRYHSPFKADTYSPLTGQFVFQNDYILENRPDLNIFLHFRITRFTGYIRVENLNAVDKKVNFRAQNYPDRNIWVRFGIFWNFVN